MSTDALANGWARALGGERKQFDMFFDKMLDGFAYHKIVVDNEGKPIDYVFLEVNHVFEIMTGLKREQIIGKKVTMVLPGIENDPADWIGVYGKVALTGESIQFENHAVPLGKWFQVSAYCPEKGYFAALFEDITERKKAESTLRESGLRYRQLFNSITDMFSAVDFSYFIMELVHDKTGKPIDGIYREVNPATERLIGKTREQLIGKSRKQLFGDINDLFPEKFDVVAKTGNPSHFESYGAALRKFYDVYVWKVAENQVGVILTDISERRNAEEALKQRTWQLESTQKKLEENAVQLEEYASQMEELAEQRANQLKNSERLAAIGATAGMVGHDIRNPLQTIVSDVYLLKSDLITMSDSEKKDSVKESLESIEKNIDYINKIVADLQDFARPLNPIGEEANLKLIINELLTKNGLPENVKVSVAIEDVAGKFKADSTFISRIVYNLVNNAVQAMPKGGDLAIRAFKDNNDVVITVKDTGVGIPEGIKSKLFTPMFTTKAKGQGFGLVVIKRMTEALGGTVTFESQEGKGTTFFVRLPQ